LPDEGGVGTETDSGREMKNLEAGDDEGSSVDRQARGRSLRLIDFLEEYFAQRYPPVYDIADYRDFCIRPADLPDTESAVLDPTAAAWLTITLADLPNPPTLPAALEGRVRLP